MFDYTHVLLAAISFCAGFLLAHLKDLQSIRERFGSPVDGGFDINWTGKQLINLISYNASERWYEARTYLDQGIFISLLSAIGLIYTVRFEYQYAPPLCEEHFSRTRYYHGFRKQEALFDKVLADSKVIQKKEGVASFYNGAYVTGYNFIHNSAY